MFALLHVLFVGCGPDGTDAEPVVNIVRPDGADAFCVGETIEFAAESRDPENTTTFVLPDNALTWYLEESVPFGTGHLIRQDFPAGEYNVSVEGVSESGAVASDAITILVEDCADEPPSVEILTPDRDSGLNDDAYIYVDFDDARQQWYVDVELVGMGEDPEDGALEDASLVWTTDQVEVQDAELGTGATLTVRLFSDECFGTTHTITLTGTDSAGNSRSTTRMIRVWTLC